MKRLVPLLFILFSLHTSAQNCKINVATNKVCLGNTLLFSVSFDAGFTATSYSWNFGNAATSTQSSPVYQYPARGKYVPTVTIQFSNSSSCTVSGDTVQVVDNPKADFTVNTPASQCFNGNAMCISDNSIPGLDNAPVNGRLFLWGDGAFNNMVPGNPNICYSYPNPLGGVFSLVLEVTDANNCMARKELKDYVTIYSKMQSVSFTTSYAVQCGKTPVTFTNTSKLPLSQVKNYTWDFGDGTKATSPWTGFVHQYTTKGVFIGKLAVEDKNGCRDTFTLNPAGENFLMDSVIHLNQTKSCFAKNLFTFSSDNESPSSQIQWSIYREGFPQIYDTIINQFGFIRTFSDCGRFKIKMFLKMGVCSLRVDTFVDVWGPKSVIETKPDAIINSIQCEVHDTVFFRDPVGDHSCYHGNGAMFRLWDFDDPFAPSCTTDTKNGINIGLNCAFSKDSGQVYHNYTPGQDQCYNPKLILYDPVTGCRDTSEAALKLTQPDAGWDSISNPVRPGLTWEPAVPCLNQDVVFDLKYTLPQCGREMAWIMVDTACPDAHWQPIDTSANTYKYVYRKTCNPNGKVTVGLIIKNGKDKNGNPCYDTAYYYDIFKFLPMDPAFLATRINTGCKPWRFKVTLNDTIQDSITEVSFNFNEPGGIFWVRPYPNDSVIPSHYFTYNTPGIKRITVGIKNTRNCILYSEQILFLGYYKNFKPTKDIYCLSDSVSLIDEIYYFTNSYPYWRDSLRAKAGKEQVYWDFGDGKGFVKSGGLPKYKYDRVGNYRIRMVTVDSLGCRDTVVYPRLLKITDVNAIIKSMQPRYLCAPQILAFKDLSEIIDSSKLYNQQPYDTIKIWDWEFGDNKLNSGLRNPVHDYTVNGQFTVKLRVQTYNGCIDSTSIPINIDGPKPSFAIQSDTVGCAPFEVNLKNTTGYPLINWVWFFRDPNNTTASTQLDTNVRFTYKTPGVYKIYLVGEDTLFNPLTGQYKTCWQAFPDSLNPNSPVRTVRVIASAHADLLIPDTVCTGMPFTAYARPDKLVPGFAWLPGDTTLLKQTLFPDTSFRHTYYIPGKYTFRMYPVSSSSLCTDTSKKDVTVINIKADFDIDNSETPLIKFTNKSAGANRYEWDFGHPRSGSKNFSTLENPTHSYAGDTGTFLVCLKSFNSEDCYDSICKRILPAEMRLVIPNVFTPNGDGLNDGYDIDIVGYTYYYLTIYNRWGNKVYESDKDGFGDDGVNWNGKNFNDGRECPEGTYYFVFRYQMVNKTKPDQVSGTINLLRD